MEWEAAFDFMKHLHFMPYLLKCLWDIEKDSPKISNYIHVFSYPFDDSVYLFYGCVFISEIKLTVGNYFLPFHY